MNTVLKVTAFILREREDQKQLLLFRHPYAGIQLPAGTVETGETPEEAVLREVFEESGLLSARVMERLGVIENELQPGKAVIYQSTTVYSRPDKGSFDWASLPKGITVDVLQTAGEWSQVTYSEWDRFPNPQYVSMQITGWAPNSCLAWVKKRYLFRLVLTAETPELWDRAADNHIFSFFWAPLSSLPSIVEPQRQWLELVKDRLL